MRVADLLPVLDAGEVVGDPEVEVQRAEHDSRRVTHGDLFCCVPGAASDGHDHADEAVRRGAAALLVERRLPLLVPQVVVPAVRPAMAAAAARLAGDPSHDLAVVGVTGTNGKTTTTHLLASICEAAGRPAAVLGTLSGARTTPESTELQDVLAHHRDAGREVVALEVSSHALVQHRVDRVRFAVAVFTNLTVDHLDYHGTMEAYFEAKALLFDPDRTAEAVIDVDDPWGRELARRAVDAGLTTTTYSVDDADDLHLDRDGTRFRWRGLPLTLPLAGRFNVANALGAAHAAHALGIPDEAIATGLSSAPPVPGRMERIQDGQPFDVLVDFAHTPDALEHVLAAADELAGDSRVHVVFGAGGDRDHSKRPLMGAVAGRLADHVVLTTDNARSEDPAAIADAVRVGVERVEPHRAEVEVVLDRDAAIRRAIDAAVPGDVVVIAGKGHEATQTIGGRVEPFDDVAVAHEALAARLDRLAGDAP